MDLGRIEKQELPEYRDEIKKTILGVDNYGKNDTKCTG